MVSWKFSVTSAILFHSVEYHLALQNHYALFQNACEAVLSAVTHQECLALALEGSGMVMNGPETGRTVGVKK